MSGECAPELAPVRAEFLALYAENRERGSQLAVALASGRVALDLAGGRDADVASHHDKLTLLFSSTKVVESLVVAMLADRGLLDLDAPLQRYVPEFHSSLVAVSDVMRYRAGAACPDRALYPHEAMEMLSDPLKTRDFVVNHLSREFDPKRPRRMYYHPFTRGLIVSVLVHAVAGVTTDEFVQRHVVAPLREKHRSSGKLVEFHVGCPPDKQGRVVESEPHRSLLKTGAQIALHRLGVVDWLLRPADEAARKAFHWDWLHASEADAMLRIAKPRGSHRRALKFIRGVRLGTHNLANSRDFRALPLSSSCGVSNAVSMALILAELAAGGGVLLSPNGFAKAMEVDGPTMDGFARQPFTITAAGWCTDIVPEDHRGDLWVGWCGAGGSVSCFSPKLRAAMCYLPSRLDERVFYPNGFRMAEAVAAALGGAQHQVAKL